MTKNKKGYTLVEIMVVMAIIAVLATLILGAIQLARRTATETAQRSNAKTVQTALEAVFAKYRVYCETTAVAGNGIPTCGTQSLTTAATEMGVDLTKSVADTGKCAAAGTREGGGALSNLTGNSYAIYVANAECTGWTSLPDVIQVNLATKIDTGNYPTIAF